MLLVLLIGLITQAELAEISGLLRSGRTAEALNMLEPMARRQPEDAVIAGLLGRARLHAGDAKGAVQPLLRSLSVLAEDGEGYNNLGVAFMQLDRTDEAAKAFARAAVLMPRQPQAWRNLAGAYTNLKRHDDAIAAWARYIAFVPSDTAARCVYGGLLLEKQKLRDAAIQLRAGATRSKDPVCLHDYADTLGRLGEPTEALKILDRLLRVDPRDAHAHYLRAYILVDLAAKGSGEHGAQALKAIESSIAIAPKRAASHHLQGVVLSQLGRHEEALKAYGRASDLEPKNSLYAEADAIARVQVGEGEKVRRVLERLVRQQPENVDAARALAHVHMAAKRWPEALRALRGLKGSARSAEVDRAVILMAMGKQDAALKVLEDLRVKHPDHEPTNYNLALVLRQLGRPAEALKAATRARKAAGTAGDASRLEARILLDLGRAPEALDLLQSAGLDDGQSQYIRARALRLRGRLPEALALASRVEKEATDEETRGAARLLRGKLLTDLGRGSEAIGLFREPGASAVELGIALSRAGRAKEAIKVLGPEYQNDAEASLAYAASMGQIGQIAKQKQILERAHKRWPRHGGVVNDLALVWLAQGKRSHAVALLEQGVKDNPGHVALVRNYARHLVETKRRRQAIELLRRGIAKNPHSGSLHTALGELLMGARRDQEAKTAFAQALRAGSPDPLAQARLGDLARRRGHLEEAEKLYGAAIKLRPGMLEAHNGLGLTLHGLEQFDEAIAQYRTGLAHAPNDPELSNNMGSSLYLKGLHREALGAFEVACTAAPHEVSYWRNRIMILKEMGKLEAAQKVLDAAQKRHPKSPVLKNEAISLSRAKAVRDRMAKDGPGVPHPGKGRR